jgi:16S rRNA (guanine(966)-N(2))-methyltransferase RsmD
MKIISGDLKGRRLINPEGTMVRPTGSRVKEALFSIIGDMIDGATFVDIFCGTGNIGIEAISRGAGRSIFIERNPKVAEILRRNIKTLGLMDRSQIVTLDALKAIKVLAKQEQVADIVFLDPPYAYNRVSEIIFAVSANDLVGTGGMLIWQHSTKTNPEAAYGGLRRDTTRVYGDTAITFFSKE